MVDCPFEDISSLVCPENSKPYPDGNCFLATSSIALMASPELKPGLGIAFTWIELNIL
ncbi:hypothetical protein D3C87_2016320 [compost metagenome]